MTELVVVGQIVALAGAIGGAAFQLGKLWQVVRVHDKRHIEHEHNLERLEMQFTASEREWRGALATLMVQLARMEENQRMMTEKLDELKEHGCYRAHEVHGGKS